MIERVARVLCGLAGLDPDQSLPDAQRSLPETRYFQWEEYRGPARTIVAAMREPTVGMLRAASGSEPGTFSFQERELDWQAMIDGALSEA